jgi:hypothetical protein
MQARGQAVIVMVSDLQDPPALLVDFIQKWEEGYKIVLGQKIGSNESSVFYFLRTLYYKTAKRLADVELLEHVTDSDFMIGRSSSNSGNLKIPIRMAGV